VLIAAKLLKPLGKPGRELRKRQSRFRAQSRGDR
jgi:hypothetical protein